MSFRSIPILPVLSAGGWKLSGRDKSVEETVSGLNVLGVESGTAAIALALRDLGATEKSEVLVPAYNCPSMREPIRVNKSKVVLYAVDSKLRIDLADIELKITEKTKAILVPHYFGFSQRLTEIKRICQNRQLVLIEDCAHALFRYSGNREIGTHGDYVIGSMTKFYPVTEGGVLASPQRELASIIDQNQRLLKINLKTLANAVESAIDHGRLWLLRPLFRVLLRTQDLSRRPSESPSSSVVVQPENKFDYIDPDNFGRPLSLTTRIISRFYSLANAARKRRENYVQICEGIADLRHCKALLPNLGPRTIPYMVPVLISDSEKVFRVLKNSGVPMYRWEDCGESDCTISKRYSRELIHLPCHEQLNKKEIETIIRLLRDVLG